MKLRTRFAIAGTLCSTVIALGVGGLAIQQTTRDLRTTLDAQLTARVTAVAPVVGTAADRDRLIDVLAANAQGVGIQVLFSDGSEVRAGDVPIRPARSQAMAAQTVRENGKRWRVTSANVASSNFVGVTPESVRVFASLSDLQRRIDFDRRQVGRISLFGVGVAALLSWVVGGYAARPLRRLTRATETGAPANIPDNQGVVEVDELGSTLNRLLSELDVQHTKTKDALETAKAFSWNAVHELRTPLTSMRADLDVLSQHAELSDENRAEIVAGLVAQHERITALLAALHDLARTDLQSKDLFTDVDLAETVDASCESARSRYAEATFELNCPDHVWTKGWAEGLRLMVDNLVENALRHGASVGQPAHVVVTLTESAERLRLVVDDAGPGVAEHDRQRIFERFSQAAHSGGGLGLGLALVDQQVQLHAGTIAIETSPLGGARFDIDLPRA